MKKILDEATLLKLRKRMVIHAQKCKNPSPEDVASEYVVRLLSGLHQKATVSQAYIDIMRNVANSRSKYYEAQLALEQGVKEPDKVLEYVGDPIQSVSTDERMDLEKLVSEIRHSKTRYIVQRRLIGLTNKEIAAELDCTEAYVHHLLKKWILEIRSRDPKCMRAP